MNNQKYKFRMKISMAMSVMKDEDKILTGKTLHVYRYALKKGKPIGIREVQRALKFSSPTLASYHLAKLEEGGLLKQTAEGYVVDKVILQNFVRLKKVLIPKYLFYSLFFATATVFEIALFRPSELTKEYVFATAVMIAATLSFAYETIVMLLKNRI
jgi:DNA-binding transcriptional ArsR family regulator